MVAVGLGYDAAWRRTRPPANKRPRGPPVRSRQDATTTNGWVGVISKMDSPQEFRDTRRPRRDRAQLRRLLRVQDPELGRGPHRLHARATRSTRSTTTCRATQDVHADLWGKLGIGAFTLEAEFVGSPRQPRSALTTHGPHGDAQHPQVRRRRPAHVERRREQAAARPRERLRDRRSVGQHTRRASTNIAYANLLGGARRHRRSASSSFNREYKVDLILWRHLIGAVTNAAYVKPFLQYDLTKSITFKVVERHVVRAASPVATPGNSTMYGTEFDTDLGYHTGGCSPASRTACCSRSARGAPGVDLDDRRDRRPGVQLRSERRDER